MNCVRQKNNSSSMEAVIHKVACVGASITYGQTLSNQEEECYPAVLQRLFGAGYEVRSFGRSSAGIWYEGYAPYTFTDEYKKQWHMAQKSLWSA